MEAALIALVGLVLAETTYLTIKTTKRSMSTANGDILLDTSVLIDGRILAIARSGLLGSRLIVPRSVVRELQFMADKADHDKRERARYGLEVIEKLQQLPGVIVVISDDGATSEHGVDEQLILIARRSGAKLCTIDYNLNKAARVQAVDIININELAHALRVIHLPGEKITVDLVQPGQDKKQAVGYLDDGTMVVVDDSRDLIGQSVAVELTRVLQTTAGRMMFARRLNAAVAKDRATKPTQAHAASHVTTPESPRQPEAGRPKKQNLRQPRGRKTRTTAEDSMVDLANQ